MIAQQNVGVPLSDYTPVKVIDPGSDGILGTADDQVLTLYNRNPAALGRDFLVLSNPALHARSEGLEVGAAKRLLRAWEVSLAFTAEHTAAVTSPGNSPFANDIGFVGSLGTDPNTYLNGGGWTYFDRGVTGKVTAYYAAPRGFHFGAVASYYDGVPFARMLFVNGFNQGPFFVRATPTNDFQTELNATLDVRLARDFKLAKGTLSGYLDVFNVLNANSNTREADLTGPTFLSRVPLAVEAPRTARLGFQWKF